MVAQLLRALDKHRQVALECAHVRLGHDEVRPLQARLGDVTAEHAFRRYLRLDSNSLAALSGVRQTKVVMERVESGLKAG